MITVYPRKKLDFTYGNIFKAFLYSFSSLFSKKDIEKDIEALWPGHKVIVGLSVRSIFDLLIEESYHFAKASAIPLARVLDGAVWINL